MYCIVRVWSMFFAIHLDFVCICVLALPLEWLTFPVRSTTTVKHASEGKSCHRANCFLYICTRHDLVYYGQMYYVFDRMFTARKQEREIYFRSDANLCESNWRRTRDLIGWVGVSRVVVYPIFHATCIACSVGIWGHVCVMCLCIGQHDDVVEHVTSDWRS